jgi:small subunit ribosomal protein S16
MALVIRMRQQGRKNRQTFRLVVTDKRNPRDGKYLETVGSYDPHRAQNNLQINTERLSYWLSKGAEISETAQKLVKKIAPEIIQGLKDQKNASRVKQAAQRRRLSKKEVKKAAPVAKVAKKAAAPAPVEAAPKKRRTTTKKAKDES